MVVCNQLVQSRNEQMREELKKAIYDMHPNITSVSAMSVDKLLDYMMLGYELAHTSAAEKYEARIKELEAENFKLAAGICHNAKGDEYGNLRCGAAEKYKGVLEALRSKLYAEKCRSEMFVKMLSRIALFMKPNNIELPDGRVMEYSPPDAIIRTSWDGLTSAIKDAQEAVKQEAERRALATIGQE